MKKVLFATIFIICTNSTYGMNIELLPNRKSATVRHDLSLNREPKTDQDQMNQWQITSLHDIPKFPALRLLTLHSIKVRSLAGMLSFPQLQELSLYATSIDSLKNMPFLPALQILNITYMGGMNTTEVQIRSLKGIENLPVLQELNLCGTKQLTFADMPNVPTLLKIRLRGAMAPGVFQNMPILPALQELYLYEIESLDGIPAFPNLRKLYLNEIGSVYKMPIFPALQELHLNKIKSSLASSGSQKLYLPMLQNFYLTIEAACEPCPSIELFNFPALKTLELVINFRPCCKGCNGNIAGFRNMFFPSVRELNLISKERSIESFMGMSMFPELQKLRVIAAINSLKGLPVFPKLTELDLSRASYPKPDRDEINNVRPFLCHPEQWRCQKSGYFVRSKSSWIENKHANFSKKDARELQKSVNFGLELLEYIDSPFNPTEKQILEIVLSQGDRNDRVNALILMEIKYEITERGSFVTADENAQIRELEKRLQITADEYMAIQFHEIEIRDIQRNMEELIAASAQAEEEFGALENNDSFLTSLATAQFSWFEDRHAAIPPQPVANGRITASIREERYRPSIAGGKTQPPARIPTESYTPPEVVKVIEETVDGGTFTKKLKVEKVIGDGSCGYRAIDPDRNRAHSPYDDPASRQGILGELIRFISRNSYHSQYAQRLIVPEIKNLFYGNRVPRVLEELYAMRNFLTELEALQLPEDQDVNAHIREIIDNVPGFCEIAVPQYLKYLSSNNVWSELPETTSDGSHVSGGEGTTNVLDAIAYMLGFNLVIVRNGGEGNYRGEYDGRILHRYQWNPTENTVYLAYNGNNHFDRLKEIKRR
ncbi:MAG: hypothetical protein LBQ08_03095 [Holosporaceae bacterium]|jgi:hypothetical protein|nr:hypothetical protein [Holosporaceae bacterium]